MIKKWILFLTSSILLVLNSSQLSFATDNLAVITIGSSTALEGQERILGNDMTLGEQIYFNKINASGGIGGKKLRLIVYNDSYEPTLAAPNMRKLIMEDKVLANIGNVGSPTAVVSVPISIELKTLLYGCYAGSDFLRQTPPDRYVFNFRASYVEETSAMMKALLKAGVKPEEIAFFTQNDSFGDAGFAGAVQALKNAGYQQPENLAHGRFIRNTLNVEEGLTDILDAKVPPKAIILVAPHLPASKFIKLASKEFPNAIYLIVSFAGGYNIAKEVGDIANEHVIMTQVVPSYDSNLPAVKEYRETLTKYAKNNPPNYISLEGFLATKLFVLALKRANETHKLTREGIIDVFENMHNVDIGINIPISFDKNNHQALHTVWPTILKDGKFISLNWDELSKYIKE